VPELIALARSKPGGLNVAAGGVGASHHLAAELFRVVRIAAADAASPALLTSSTTAVPSRCLFRDRMPLRCSTRTAGPRITEVKT
jgi:hypothetical protein